MDVSFCDATPTANSRSGLYAYCKPSQYSLWRIIDAFLVNEQRDEHVDQRHRRRAIERKPNCFSDTDDDVYRNGDRHEWPHGDLCCGRRGRDTECAATSGLYAYVESRIDYLRRFDDTDMDELERDERLDQ